MGRFNMWMANLMRGRYGMDHQLACGCFADIYLLSCIFKEHKQESG